jgi:hypothetical protein
VGTGAATGNAVNFATDLPVNHGLFYTTKLIANGKVFYCPSMGTGPFEQTKYAYENFLKNGVWPAYNVNPTWNANLRSSYMYYPCTAAWNNGANNAAFGAQSGVLYQFENFQLTAGAIMGFNSPIKIKMDAFRSKISCHTPLCPAACRTVNFVGGC